MPQFVLYIPERRIKVSTRGEACCSHNRLAVKHFSRTPDNFNRYFFACDGCICGPRYSGGWSRRWKRGWIWQDELISSLEQAYVEDELIDIVEDLPARLSARTRAEIQAQPRFSGANPGSNY